MSARRLAVSYLAAALLVCGQLHAQVTVYTDQAAFLAAVKGPVEAETFEGEVPGLVGEAATIGPLTFSSPGSSLSILSSPHPHGAANTTPGGAHYLLADSGVVSYHDDLDCGRVGNEPMTAWGATFTDLEIGPIVFFVDGVKVVDQALGFGQGVDVGFFGFVAADGETFQTVRLDIPDITYGIDDVYSSVCSTAYGIGCAGSGGFVPELTMSPCDPPAGTSVTLSVSGALGGSTAILALGQGQAQAPLGGGCSLLVAPLLPALLSFPLSGAVGPGTGTASIAGPIPAGTSGASFTAQVFVVDPGATLGFSASNGWQIDIQ